MTSTRTAFLFSLLCILFASFFSENLYARKITRNLTGFDRLRYNNFGYYGNYGSLRYYLNCYLQDMDAIACVGEEESDRIRIIDRKSGYLKNTIRIPYPTPDLYPYPLIYSSNHSSLILDGLDYIEIPSGNILNDFGDLNADSNKIMGARSIKITSDGKYLIGLFSVLNGQLYNGNDKLSTIYKIDYQTGTVVDSFPQNETIYDFVFDEANNRLITYCKDENIYIWDYFSKKISKSIYYHIVNYNGSLDDVNWVLLNQSKNKDLLYYILKKVVQELLYTI
ncbi:MAG: hypothetical protein ACM3U1_11550 [Chloroflexota bacterium]